MKRILGNLLVLILTVAGFLEGGEGRREKEGLHVRLEIPRNPKVGDRVILGCKYELGTDTLYTVKWYKGIREFYRFTPKEAPSVKIFEFPGLEVDRSQSNATQLTLSRVDLGMSGKYSCEVTTDAPDFTTDLKTESLNVIALPSNRRPTISPTKPRYSVGDTLDVSCSSYRSKPAANLTWYINSDPADVVVQVPRTEKSPDRDNMHNSRLHLRLQLQPSFFRNGRLSLKCIASIYDRYTDSSEITILEDDTPKISSVVDNSSSQSHSHSRSNTWRQAALGSHAIIIVCTGLVLSRWHSLLIK